MAGGIDSTSHAYDDTAPVVGFTTQCDLSSNKMFERELHAEMRSHLYQPFNNDGVPRGGYDSVDRLRKALRGKLSSDGGYAAGSITTPIALPNTDASRDYDLDGLGNWKQSDYIPVGGTATIDLRQHNKLNQITSRKVGDDTKVLFAYDKNGNLNYVYGNSVYQIDPRRLRCIPPGECNIIYDSCMRWRRYAVILLGLAETWLSTYCLQGCTDMRDVERDSYRTDLNFCIKSLP